MANILSPTSATAAEVDTKAKSVRVVQRPLISNSLGSYACSMFSGGATPSATGTITAGLTANSLVWAFRYTGSALCIVDKVVLDGTGASTAFVAGVHTFRLFVARAYTVFDATGATTATISGNFGKLDTSYGTTAVGNIGISNTGAMSGGTKTLDNQAIGQVSGGLTTGLPEGTLYDAYSTGHPIVLANNEGLTLFATVPGTGVWGFGITAHWAEVTSSEWH